MFIEGSPRGIPPANYRQQAEKSDSIRSSPRLMDNLQDLVKKGRALEAGGQPAPALEAYLRALAVATPEAETNLRTRIGLLQLRLGRVDEGASMLDQAAERYAASGLANNAIALCQRVLDVDPSRVTFLHRLADLCHAQGYLDEARREFADHAAALEAAGDAQGAAESRREYDRRYPSTSPVAPPPPVDPPPPQVRAAAPERALTDDDRSDDAALGLMGNLPERGEASESRVEETVVADRAEVPAASEADSGLLEGLETTHAGWDRPATAELGEALQLQGNEPLGGGAPLAAEEPGEDAPLPLLSGDFDAGSPAALAGADSGERDRTDGPAIDDADAASQFDLAIAFQEMGLWDDAISHLERALAGGFNPVASLELLGRAYVEKGEAERALASLERAASMAEGADATLVGVHYWTGRALEASGANPDAAESYRKVVTADAAYRDAAARLESLSDG